MCLIVDKMQNRLKWLRPLRKRDRGSEISIGNVYKRKEKLRKMEREMVG